MTDRYDPFWKTVEYARQYDEFTRTTFSGIYETIAMQVLERTGINRGICLDIGSGPAPLAIAIALLSDLSVMALDSSPAMHSIAMQNVRMKNLDGVVIPVFGDVHAIPADNGKFDLVVSRGSYHFWDDLTAALKEICRVLKDGGKAYIGGGYGSLRVRDQVTAMRKKRGTPNYPPHDLDTRFRKFRPGEIEQSIVSAGIGDYRIINDDSGFWIMFTKSE